LESVLLLGNVIYFDRDGVALPRELERIRLEIEEDLLQPLLVTGDSVVGLLRLGASDEATYLARNWHHRLRSFYFWKIDEVNMHRYSLLVGRVLLDL